jgi:hypothetical protein
MIGATRRTSPPSRSRLASHVRVAHEAGKVGPFGTMLSRSRSELPVRYHVHRVDAIASFHRTTRRLIKAPENPARGAPWRT